MQLLPLYMQFYIKLKILVVCYNHLPVLHLHILDEDRAFIYQHSLTQNYTSKHPTNLCLLKYSIIIFIFENSKSECVKLRLNGKIVLSLRLINVQDWQSVMYQIE